MLSVIEIIIVVALAAAFITQVLVPVIRGTVMFPVFQRENELTDQLKAERQKLHEAELEVEIQQLRSQLNQHNVKGE